MRLTQAAPRLLAIDRAESDAGRRLRYLRVGAGPAGKRVDVSAKVRPRRRGIRGADESVAVPFDESREVTQRTLDLGEIRFDGLRQMLEGVDEIMNLVRVALSDLSAAIQMGSNGIVRHLTSP